MKGSLTLLCAFLCLSFQAHAQDSTQVVPKKIYETKDLKSVIPPTIDGLLDDVAWNEVAWAGDFIENRPDENTSPSYQTKFKIVYDEKFLYIGVRCLDSLPDQIVKRLSRRDGFEGDWIEFNIDSYHDQRTAFSFTTSVSGVKGDEFISNNGNNWDESWNPIWYTKTNIDSLGWTAELKIPFSQLRFSSEHDQVWGLQAHRRLFREEERSLWQRIPRDAAGWVNMFGELHGIQGIKPQKQLEIQPYVVAQTESFEREVGNPFRTGRKSDLKVGLDAKIGITNDLTMDLTINPDFGQIEADPAAIALDGFQIFFQEQRTFFVENKNIFELPFSRSQAGNTYWSDNLFYSRRIGRSPQGWASTATGADYVDTPNNTTILGAAKFSGKTKNGWSIGVLESITAKEYALIDDGMENEVSRREEEIEPLTNYFVGRLQKDFNEGDSYLGGMITSTRRDINTDNLDFLHRKAETGALDFKHTWKERAWYLKGNLIFSHVQGSTNAITNTQSAIGHLFAREDAEHLSLDSSATSLTGTGGNLQLGKQGNGRWNFETGATWRSPELELNDIGFQRLSDEIRHYTWIGYRTLKPSGPFRQIGINYNHWSAWDFGGNHNLTAFNTNSWMNFKGNQFFNLGLNFRPKHIDNFALRGGPRLRSSSQLNYWTNFNSDNRKKFRIGFGHSGARTSDGSFKSINFWNSLTYQPANAVRISLNPSYNVSKNQQQYVTTVDFNGTKQYVTGRVNQKTLSASIRINYTINPTLTIQYYGQPFISQGTYDNFNFIADASKKHVDDRLSFFDDVQIDYDPIADEYGVDQDRNGSQDFTIYNPDFSFISFRSNLVARWEYIPGSELFFVWSQGTTGSGDTDLGVVDNLSNQIFDRKPNNIFLIKATYRLVL